MSRIHLSLPNAYTLMCFDRNINGNRDVKFLILVTALMKETYFRTIFFTVGQNNFGNKIPIFQSKGSMYVVDKNLEYL